MRRRGKKWGKMLIYLILIITAVLSPLCFTEPSSRWCMCGRGTHFTYHLCITCLSGRCQPKQWWYHYSQKKITYLWSRDMPWNGEEDEEKKVMFRVILSPGPDVLALLSFSLQRKHTLIQTIGEICKCQNIALACFVTVCLVLDCQNWVRLPLKIYSKASHWRFETMWHNRVCNLVIAAK